MRSPYLRVKIKTLAAESQIIRKEMLKFRTTNPYYERLHHHRVDELRKEARASLIAYGFLNGLAYSEIEESSYEPPLWGRVKQIVTKFGEGNVNQLCVDLKEWSKTVRDNRGMHRAVVSPIVLVINPSENEVECQLNPTS